jgi:hypothetical protein
MNRAQLIVLVVGLLGLLVALGIGIVPLRGTCGTAIGEAVGDLGTRTTKVVRFNNEFRPLEEFRHLGGPLDCADLARRRLIVSGVVALLAVVGAGVAFRLLRETQ